MNPKQAPSQLSEEEKIQTIRDMMNNHNCLNPRLFDKNNNLDLLARTKLLELAEFLKKEVFNCFPKLNICDITLAGSCCSYVYNDQTDIDVFIVVDSHFLDDAELTRLVLIVISLTMRKMTSRPNFYGHSIDFSIHHKDDKTMNDYNCYSLLRNCWIIGAPKHQEFDFSPEELYKMYVEYEAKLYRFVDSLEKTEDGFLTIASQIELTAHLDSLHLEAAHGKWFSNKHEYSAEYNLYRLLKKFRTTNYFRKYIQDSKLRNINKGNRL